MILLLLLSCLGLQKLVHLLLQLGCFGCCIGILLFAPLMCLKKPRQYEVRP
jgi:hypothetical protein